MKDEIILKMQEEFEYIAEIQYDVETLSLMLTPINGLLDDEIANAIIGNPQAVESWKAFRQYLKNKALEIDEACQKQISICVKNPIYHDQFILIIRNGEVKVDGVFQ